MQPAGTNAGVPVSKTLPRPGNADVVRPDLLEHLRADSQVQLTGLHELQLKTVVLMPRHAPVLIARRIPVPNANLPLQYFGRQFNAWRALHRQVAQFDNFILSRFRQKLTMLELSRRSFGACLFNHI